MSPMRCVVLLFLLACPLHAQQQPKPGPELRVLFSYVEGSDEELRDRAIKRLLELGPAAVPFIKQRLKTPAAEHYRYVLARIDEREQLRRRQGQERARQLEALRQQQLLRQHWQRFVSAYLQSKLERIEQLGRQESFSAAIELIEALLRVEPEMPAELRARLDGLRKEYKSKRFAATAIQGEIEVERRIYAWREPLKIRMTFVVTNNSAQQYVIKSKIQARDAADVSKLVEHHSVIRVKYKVFDHHIDGRMLGKEQDIDLELNRDVSLGKDQKWRRPWTLPHVPWPGPGYAYREIVVYSRAIPVGMQAAATLHDQTKILFPTQRFKVFPPRYEQFAARPLQALRDSLRLQQPRNAFVAGLLVAPHQRAQAIEHLIESLGRQDADTTRTAFALLERLSGKRLGQDRERWRLWWLANKERFRPASD